MPLTTPALYINTSSERELSKAEDDYGNSYYFRGNVIDNYVSFADKCWRIVRIEGDGSIKLILEDQDELCSESIDGNWAIPTTRGTTYKGHFGVDARVIDSTNKIIIKAKYLTPITEATKSHIYAYYNFQTSLGGNIDKLKTEEWCLGNLESAYNYSAPYNLLEDTIDNLHYAGTDFYYETGKRLRGYGETKNATLKCNGTTVNQFQNVTGYDTWNNTGSKVQITRYDNMKVGALTAYEVAYAGGTTSNNLNYYLLNTYQTSKQLYFWTMSSAYSAAAHTDKNAYEFAFLVSNSGTLSADDAWNANENKYYFRPAISLNAGIAIMTGGEGTLESPYIIE